MIIYFELQGTKMLHKGLFDTTGFWVKYGVDADDLTQQPTSFNLWSHFSFTFESSDKQATENVLEGLLDVLSGRTPRAEIMGIGRIIVCALS